MDIIIAWKTYPIFYVNVQERNFKINNEDSMYNLNSSTKTITEQCFFDLLKVFSFINANMVQGRSELHNISEACEAR